jgi:hypothetical protein
VDSSATRPTWGWPVRLSAEDTALSRRGGGFDSLTGYSTAQGVGKPGNPPVWGTGERRFKSGCPDWLSGMWESPGIRLAWDQESAGSNPAIPTGDNRWGDSNVKPDLIQTWGRGVAAAHRPFKPGGGGSNPSGPIGGSARPGL